MDRRQTSHKLAYLRVFLDIEADKWQFGAWFAVIWCYVAELRAKAWMWADWECGIRTVCAKWFLF